MNDNSHTWREIQQQPTTAARVRVSNGKAEAQARLKDARVVVTGAGTSAYFAAAVAAAWPRSAAVPSTDLLLATERYIEDPTVLVSVGRSGDSPESRAVVERVHRLRPQIWHLTIACNPRGGLATVPLFPPRTNS